LLLTCVWSTLTVGFQATTLWQLSQLVVVVMCWAPLPVALVPLWQLKQLPVMPLWSKLAGSQAAVVWQFWQLLSVTGWFAGLPVMNPVLIATVPLWQETQVPVTCVWSTLVAGFQVVVPWQFSQVLLVAMCVGVLPVTVPVLMVMLPLWQE
jgi:hypothetical protein